MLHLLANPGVFHQTLTEFWMPLVPVAIALVLASFVVIAISMEDSDAVNPLLAGLIFLATVASIIVTGIWMNQDFKQANLAQAKYNASVASWLDTDYGIKANADGAKRLIGGETFAVTHHGQEIVISVIETLDKKLAVVDQNHTVLKPKN